MVISVIVKTWATLMVSADNASYWPYDLDYIAVDIPASNWNTGEKAAWWLLQALNNAFVNVSVSLAQACTCPAIPGYADRTQITHIQFLTLLYPSRTEARLIIFILGMYLLPSSDCQCSLTSLVRTPCYRLLWAGIHRPLWFSTRTRHHRLYPKHPQLDPLAHLYYRPVPVGLFGQSSPGMAHRRRYRRFRYRQSVARHRQYELQFCGRCGRRHRMAAASVIRCYRLADVAGVVVVGRQWNGYRRGRGERSEA